VISVTNISTGWRSFPSATIEPRRGLSMAPFASGSVDFAQVLSRTEKQSEIKDEN